MWLLSAHISLAVWQDGVLPVLAAAAPDEPPEGLEFVLMVMGVVLFLVFVLTFIFYNIFSVVRVTLKYFFGDKMSRYLLMVKIDPAYQSVLKKHCKYYQQLGLEDQAFFEKRVQKFINQKEFVARGELGSVTDEMKALVAATAIQLTFGYPLIYFEHFRVIALYPDNYYSNILKQYHQGEVNMGGMIILSWKSFVQGYFDESDGRNLGLHEMAHALRLENAVMNDEYGFLDDALLKEWTALCYTEMALMDEGKSNFFRAYAASNSQEFFAVAVENFFERATAFRAEKPHLYQVLKEMLKQDPAARANLF